MKIRNNLFLACATLGGFAALSLSSPALALCCKMKMAHSAKAEEAKDAGESALEPADPQRMPGMKKDMPGMEKGKEGEAGKKAAKEAKDPVCSMTVEDPKTAEKSVYKGKTYYFCGREDKEAFEKSPEKYLTPGKKAKGS
ncbi:MAG: YHS domain-containing protein [Terriglobia bacterium]